MRIGIDLDGTKIEAIALADTATGATLLGIAYLRPWETNGYACPAARALFELVSQD